MARVSQVLTVIEEWHPRSCATEKDFERSLIKRLEEKFPDVDIIKQYAAGRVKGDIVIDDRILIEIKHEVDGTGKLQRLLGQIEIYREKWKGQVIIVVCGKSDKDLYKALQKRIDALTPGLLDVFNEQKFWLRTKDKSLAEKSSGWFS